MDRARRAPAPRGPALRGPALRGPALCALAVAAVLLASGCTATNPQLTHDAEVTYNPSDGTNVALGPIRVQSMMVVSDGGQAPGALVARLVNTTLQPHRVTFTGTGGTTMDETFEVPANSILPIGPDERDAVVLDPVGAQPGELVRLTVSADVGGSETAVVPVLSGALPEYATLVPTPPPTTTTPPPTTTTPSASGTPGTSGSPSGSATRTTGTPSSSPVVTSSRTASPTGGAPASKLPGQYSPSGTPTG